jgi:hypothetical protein
MTYEKAAKAAYLGWMAKDSVEAKRLSDFFSRCLPDGKARPCGASYDGKDIGLTLNQLRLISQGRLF